MRAFVDSPAAKPPVESKPAPAVDLAALKRAAANDPAAGPAYADALQLFGGDTALDEAITIYDSATGKVVATIPPAGKGSR